MFEFAYANDSHHFKHSHSHQTMRIFCECECVSKSLPCICNEPSTRADCFAKSLITNQAGILDSSSEDEGSDLESEDARNTQERKIKAQLKAYRKEKRAAIDENPMDR